MKKLIIVSLVCGLLNAVAVDKPQQETPQKEKPQIDKPAKPHFPRHWGKPDVSRQERGARATENGPRAVGT